MGPAMKNKKIYFLNKAIAKNLFLVFAICALLLQNSAFSMANKTKSSYRQKEATKTNFQEKDSGNKTKTKGANNKKNNRKKNKSLRIFTAYINGEIEEAKKLEGNSSKGCCINALDRSGRSAIFHALIKNDYKSVEKLLECGADTEIIDSFGSRPADYANKLGFMDIFYALECHRVAKSIKEKGEKLEGLEENIKKIDSTKETIKEDIKKVEKQQKKFDEYTHKILEQENAVKQKILNLKDAMIKANIFNKEAGILFKQLLQEYRSLELKDLDSIEQIIIKKIEEKELEKIENEKIKKENAARKELERKKAAQIELEEKEKKAKSEEIARLEIERINKLEKAQQKINRKASKKEREKERLEKKKKELELLEEMEKNAQKQRSELAKKKEKEAKNNFLPNASTMPSNPANSNNNANYEQKELAPDQNSINYKAPNKSPENVPNIEAIISTYKHSIFSIILSSKNDFELRDTRNTKEALVPMMTKFKAVICSCIDFRRKLLSACKKEEALEIFLKCINSPNENGRTPQFLALSFGLFEIAEVITKILKENGAKEKLFDNYGRNPAFTAYVEGDLETVEELKKMNLGISIDINQKDEFGESPIFSCIKCGNFNIAKKLLDNGAIYSIDEENSRGLTTLQLAYIKGREDIVQKILQSSESLGFGKPTGDGLTKNSKGRSAMFYAISTGDVKAIEIIRKNAILDKEENKKEKMLDIENIYEVDKIGQTPIFLSCQLGQFHAIKRLREKFSSEKRLEWLEYINKIDEYKKTPLDYAIERFLFLQAGGFRDEISVKIIEFLIAEGGNAIEYKECVK